MRFSPPRTAAKVWDQVVRDGKSEQRSVDGQAPISYQEQGTIVSVSFQKKQASGTLGVEISAAQELLQDLRRVQGGGRSQS